MSFRTGCPLPPCCVAPLQRAAGKAIAAVIFPTQTPDASPEYILRAADLDCTTSAGCKLHLLYAWQAKDEALGSLRRSLTSPPPPVPPSPAPPNSN